MSNKVEVTIDDKQVDICTDMDIDLEKERTTECVINTDLLTDEEILELMNQGIKDLPPDVISRLDQLDPTHQPD